MRRASVVPRVARVPGASTRSVLVLGVGKNVKALHQETDIQVSKLSNSINESETPLF